MFVRFFEIILCFWHAFVKIAIRFWRAFFEKAHIGAEGA
jgi:hypothetical protein